MICHYSTVLDVFAQHHPEYVSLVWGSFKVLFISAVNHGETLKLLSKSLVQVAQRLPQVEILSTLYPTKQIRLVVETLYAGILEFLLIAHSWCKESKFSHFYHSFTRPHELHYNELLERISDCSNSINELANIGSHSEIRVMHKTQATFHSIQTSAQLDTNQQLSDLQLSQALSTFAQLFEDPDHCYKNQLRLRNRRACGKGRVASTNEFWLSPRLASCATSQGSSIAIIKGSFTLRSAIQDFGVDVIQTLVASTAPTLWVLTGATKSGSKVMSTSTDLVKTLTYQALRLHGAVRTEKQMSIRYSQLQTASCLGEWLDLFKQVIGTLGGHVHLVVDLATARASFEALDGVNFVQELNKRLGEMSQQGNGTTVKIFLLVYEAEWFRLIPDELSGNTIAVKAAGGRRKQSKEMKRAVNKRVLSTSVRRQKCRA
ncbi:nacht domain [Fusarium albosuccineum]|uniref:Nacht domain n=1 Tax=Fusarium albosuccineum TaxID=1237068 RepID=A0A8H4L5X6_9HYPO|nr:nacht domain [Fusarium albosuccineum]